MRRRLFTRTSCFYFRNDLSTNCTSICSVRFLMKIFRFFSVQSDSTHSGIQRYTKPHFSIHVNRSFFCFLTSSTLSKIFRYCLQSIRRGLHATDSSCYSKLSNTNRYFTESKQYLLDLFFFYYYFDSIPCSRRIEMGLSSTIFPCRSCLGNFEQRYHIFRSFFSSINFVFQSYETFTTRNQSKSWILSPMTRSTFDHRWSTSNTMSFLWPVSAKAQLLMWEKSKQKWLNPMFCLNRLRSKLNIEWI